jgi:hypothetical protein
MGHGAAAWSTREHREDVTFLFIRTRSVVVGLGAASRSPRMRGNLLIRLRPEFIGAGETAVSSGFGDACMCIGVQTQHATCRSFYA